MYVTRWPRAALLRAEGDGGGAAAGGGGAPAGGGGGAPDPAAAAAARDAFLQQIPEQIRGEAYFKDVHDVGNLALRAWNQAKLIGRDPATMLVVPQGDDAAAWSTVYDRLGRPEAADKYALTDPTNLPQGLAIDAEVKKAFGAKAHEMGLSQAQAAGLFDWWNASRAAAFTAAGEAQTARSQETLQTLLADKDVGEAGITRAQNALAYFEDRLKFGPELRQELDRSKMGDHPALIRLLSAIGRDLEEDGMIGGGAGAGGRGELLTPAEVDQRIAALRADPEFQRRHNSKLRAERQPAIDQLAQLYELKAEANRIARGEQAA